MEQLLVHGFADYWTQSSWMGVNKSKRTWPCLLHVLLYTACFLILTTSWKALLVIGVTHFILDRYPIILKRLIWIKEHMGPGLKYVPFEKCSVTGYYDNILNEVKGNKFETHHFTRLDRKVDIMINPRLNYISIWLYIIKDNWCHLAINFLALKYL